MLNLISNMLKSAVSLWLGLCENEPSPKSRTNKPSGNLWILNAFGQCRVNMLIDWDYPR